MSRTADNSFGAARKVAAAAEVLLSSGVPMSAISGTSSQSSIYQMLSRISTASSAGGTSQASNHGAGCSSTTPTGTSGAVDGDSNAAIFAELRQQIEDAIANVLQKYGINSEDSGDEQSSETDSAETKASIDPMQLFKEIHSAMDEVLKENGIEPPSRPRPGSGGPPPMPAGGAEGASPMMELLKQSGVDPEEFRQSFLTALQQSSNGEVDFAQIFSGFPAGQAVDLLV